MTNDQEKFRLAAISGVEKARELLDELETHIREDHGQKVVQSKINDIRHELRVIFDATTRDGRMAGWFPGGGMGRMVFPQARKEDE